MGSNLRGKAKNINSSFLINKYLKLGDAWNKRWSLCGKSSLPGADKIEEKKSPVLFFYEFIRKQKTDMNVSRKSYKKYLVPNIKGMFHQMPVGYILSAAPACLLH